MGEPITLKYLEEERIHVSPRVKKAAVVFLETPTHGGHVDFIRSLTLSRTWLDERVSGFLGLAGRAERLAQ